ncbi:sugar phosphate isomerase/epimerase [Mesorhizobium sp. CA14]|uniref:sugar phosphate isomerase/epimerase family protein n=1 Tax=Mesorhizobium sp. CA14 TaxID=2876642 RepID=UPI001CCE0A3A|nr:sugar phosphate isomerase/epimerase [Mesorhizobium sp. CA14]MBZ9848139.1 sugar phosphate isomerase/epimerase [Mesorhizobium sp. CA14]
MQVGVFAKTFPGSEPTGVLAAVRDAGFAVTQFNLACAGMPSMPDEVPDAAIDAISAAAKATGINLVALSGTYNMAHPDSRMRQDGLRRLAVVIETAARLSIPLVTLCTGTRNTEDQWAYHPNNADPSAWADMARAMEGALRLAERHGVDLGIEPEQANIVASARDAIRLIAEMSSKRLRIVLDPANLFEQANADEARTTVAEAVERTAGHVALTHAKDRFADGRFATAGQGVVDFADFIAQLKATGFDGPMVTHGLSAEEAPGVARFLKGLA